MVMSSESSVEFHWNEKGQKQTRKYTLSFQDPPSHKYPDWLRLEYKLLWLLQINAGNQSNRGVQ